MFAHPTGQSGPQRALRILTLLAADLFGLAAFSLGATWFIEHKPMLIPNFPGSMAEAAAATAGGLAVMIWAVAHLVGGLVPRRRSEPAETR